MFRRTKVCSAVLLAMGGGLVSVPALAQEDTQRVEVTGSAIKRIEAETALPVQVLKRQDIERTGATSTVDLLQRLAVVQGSTQESASVGGASFGFTGVSIHGLTENRTLVLLNGHRLTQFGGQELTGFAAAFDLNSIPFSAIERVEVLTDGASALYGSDAIAGVVNFITRRDLTSGDVTIGYSAPSDGAKEKRISATKGFGSLSEDGYNVMVTLAHDDRTKLKSIDRNFASTGERFFTKDGKRYRIQQFSPRTIPGNATNDNGDLINPYLIANGECAPNSFRVIEGASDYCGFDFVSTLEIFPERKRDSAMVTGNLALGQDHQLYADLLWSRAKQVARIAPVPGDLLIAAGTPLHDTYLAPLGITTDSTVPYRLFDLGPRTNDDKASFYDVALGGKGTIGSWDYDAGYTRSRSKVEGNIAGYPGALALNRVIASGLLNPFVLPGQQSDAANQAIAAANFKGYWDGGISTLDTLAVKASSAIAKLPAGSLQLAVGANFNKEKFEKKPSLFAQGLLADPVTGELCDPANPDTCDQRFGDAAATPVYSAQRKSWGVFGELLIPALKELEFSTSVRYDHYDDFGSSTTGKASFRYRPISTLLVRGSVGSGFRAPSVPQVKAGPQNFGVTSNNYLCTDALRAQAERLGAECREGNVQYDVIAAGNPILKPEKSRQATIGLLFEPMPELSVGADLWFVKVSDSFGQLGEATVFANPGTYPGAWTSARDLSSGRTFLALNNGNLNLGNEYHSGIDFDVSSRAKTPIGSLNTTLRATYTLRDKRQLLIDGPYYNAIGNIGPLDVVTFSWRGQLATTLDTGNWAHSLAFNFQSGYKDALTTAEVLDDAGNVTGTEDIQLDVGRYYTFDWQSMWRVNKSFDITLGVLNIFNRVPPFAISGSGINRGQQFGYDDRYFDPRGRTWYANLSVKF
jgi:iron complex outermembrane recepter protein